MKLRKSKVRKKPRKNCLKAENVKPQQNQKTTLKNCTKLYETGRLTRLMIKTKTTLSNYDIKQKPVLKTVQLKLRNHQPQCHPYKIIYIYNKIVKNN